MTPDELRRVFHSGVYQENAAALLGEGSWDFSHFLRDGLELGISPTPYFDPDHVGAGSNGQPALLRWLTGNAPEAPHPLVDHELVSGQLGTHDRLDLLARLNDGDGRLLRLHPLFWGATYVAAHPSGDSIRHPLHHYLKRGWQRGHEPNPFFVGDLVPGGEAADRAPALRWLDESDANLVPTMLFDPMDYQRQRKREGTPRAMYLDFLSAGLWSDLSPSRWFDGDTIRAQVKASDEPATLTYLRLEHQLDIRPCDGFDPAAHPTLLHRPTPFGARVLERYLSPHHNPQFRRRPIALSEELTSQLHRLETIAPGAIASIREHTDNNRIRVNANDFTSPRLAVLRRIESLLDTVPCDDVLLLRSGQPVRCSGTPIDLDMLMSLPRAEAADVAAALVEVARERRIQIVIACDLGDRIVSDHLPVLIEWSSVASAWPRETS